MTPLRAPLLRAAALAAALAAVPAAAQEMSLGDAASEAVSAVKNAAQDSLLVGDLMGSDVKDPSGDVVGTVANLVAVPGGRLVAVVVASKGGGDKLLVPYRAVKISSAADKAGVTLPDSISNLRGSDAVKNLTGALSGALGGMLSGG